LTFQKKAFINFLKTISLKAVKDIKLFFASLTDRQNKLERLSLTLFFRLSLKLSKAVTYCICPIEVVGSWPYTQISEYPEKKLL
jgi:hypothetical protein